MANKKKFLKETGKEVLKNIPGIKEPLTAIDKIKSDEEFKNHDKKTLKGLKDIKEEIKSIRIETEEKNKFDKVREEADKDFSSYFYLLKEVYKEFIQKGYTPLIQIRDWIEINEVTQNYYSDLSYEELVKNFANKAIYFRMAYKLNNNMKKYLADVVYTDKNYIDINGSQIVKCSFLFLNSENSFGFWYNINRFEFEDREFVRKILQNESIDFKQKSREEMDYYFLDLNKMVKEMFEEQASLSEIKKFYLKYFKERGDKFGLSDLMAFQGVIYPENFIEDIHSGKIFNDFNLTRDDISGFLKLFDKIAFIFASNKEFYSKKILDDYLPQKVAEYSRRYPIISNIYIYDYLIKVRDEKSIPHDFTMFIFFISQVFGGELLNKKIYEFRAQYEDLRAMVLSNFDMDTKECDRLIKVFIGGIINKKKY